jgi:HTH-type transcriptional regulator/antitoxin HigA
MELKPIKTEKQHNKALAEIDKLIDCKPGSKEEDRLVVLSLLVEAYESEHYPIEPPDPIEAIKFRMEQMGLTQDDLGKLLGSKTRANDSGVNKHPSHVRLTEVSGAPRLLQASR